MTTPTDPPADETAPLPESPARPSAEAPAPPPAAAMPAAAMPAAPYYPPPPFTPVLRQPWINPARRTHVVAAAVIGALLFGGAGVLVGHAVTDHNQGGGMTRFENGRVAPGMGGLPNRGPMQNGPRHRPGGGGASTPSPSPSPSTSS